MLVVAQEKAAIREVLDRTSVRAQNNYALAAKLAQVIGKDPRLRHVTTSNAW